MNTYAAADKILFDFQTTTNTAAWQIVNDDVMGGVSRSGFRLTNGVAVFQGEVSLENNGGFASVRSLPARHDLAGCDAFVIRVRGDGRSYKFTARTARSFDSAIYQTVIHDEEGRVGRAPPAAGAIRSDLPGPGIVRRAAARSGEGHVGGLPDFRQAGRAVPTRGGVDQGHKCCAPLNGTRLNNSRSPFGYICG